MIGIIAVLIACRNLIDSLAQQLDQGMISMARRSWIINLACSLTENVETLIYLSHEKKAGIAGDLCTLKIYADGSVEIRPYRPCLFVTNYAHADSPPSNEFVT
jgi:hypothetical protein